MTPMKTKNLVTLLLFLFMAGFSGCSDDDEYGEGWYDSVPDGGLFGRANTVRFYYMDAAGNSLVNPEDTKTFPVTTGEIQENPAELSQDYNPATGLYNRNNNSISYDEEEGLYYCTMTAYGDSRQSTYSYPVYVNGDTDTIELTYKYTDKDVVGGKYWGKIISWKYNGKHVYSDDDGNNKKVYIKKANGTTTVSLKR